MSLSSLSRGLPGLWVVLLVLVSGLACEKKSPESAGRSNSDAPKADDGPRTAPPVTSLDLHHLRGRAKVHAERDTLEGYADAARHLDEIVTRSPETPLDRLNLARVLLFVPGRENDAETHVKRARELWGASVTSDVDYVEALVRKRQERYEETIPLLLKVTADQPTHKLAWYQLGLTYFRLRQYELALEAYERVLALDDENRAAAYQRFQTVARLKRPREEIVAAKARFEELESDPEFDTEKCHSTFVTLRPPARAKTEPETVELAWSKLSSLTTALADAIEDPVIDIAPFFTEARHCQAGLLATTATKISLAWFDAEDGLTSHSISTGQRYVSARGGDLDNDTATDVVIGSDDGFIIVRGTPDGDGFVIVPAEELKGIGLVHTFELFDVDHDGDLDIVAALASGWRVARNDGDLTFTIEARFGDTPVPTNADFSFDAHDLDQASDIDFVVPTGGLVALQLNCREAGFQRLGLSGKPDRVFEGTWTEPRDATIVRLDDLTGDGSPDAVVVAKFSICIYENLDRFGRPYEVNLAPQVQMNCRAGTLSDLRLADIDNDADLDLVAAGTDGVAIVRNTQGGWVPDPPIDATLGMKNMRRVLPLDIDRDRDLDLIVLGNDGRLEVWSATRTPDYHAWRVNPTGRADNRSSIGAIVEQYLGQTFQSVMIKSPGGVHLGTGLPNLDGLDGIRLRWNQGIIQALLPEDLEFVAGRPCVTFRQKEGLIASCPFLYVHGPDGWRFVTDVVGIAPLDEWLPPGGTAHQDPEEWVRLDPSLFATEDGRLRFSITEELRETTYLDRVELTVVTHDESVTVLVDESTRQERNEQRLYAIHSDSPAAVTAVEVPGYDTDDATRIVSRVDHEYVHGYTEPKSQWDGWVPRYSVDFTLTEPADALLLRGRIAWYNSTTVFSLDQHERTWGPLRLERVDDAGRVTPLVDDLGLPSGMDRTMVATWEELLPAGTRLRLSGHHRFLWDQILSARSAPRAFASIPARLPVEDGAVQTIPVSSATLGFHGYSRVTGDRGAHEQRYEYADAAPSDEFRRATGWATRYGDVNELLTAHDDHVAVLVAGDKVEFEFPAPESPRSGMRQTYFLRISGWCKEGSHHNATGREIEPLPFRDMGTYPPARPRERDDSYRRYLEEYQTREIRRYP